MTVNDISEKLGRIHDCDPVAFNSGTEIAVAYLNAWGLKESTVSKFNVEHTYVYGLSGLFAPTVNIHFGHLGKQMVYNINKTK